MSQKKLEGKDSSRMSGGGSVTLRARDCAVIVFCIAIVAMSYVIFSNTGTPEELISQSAVKWRSTYSSRNSWSDGTQLKKEYAQLEAILQKAATVNKTVIITTLNQAWATPNSMIDLFLESFHIGDGISNFLNHLIIVALDQKAYDRCLSIHSHCYVLKTEGVDFSGEKFFMSDDYVKMMWRRINLLRIVLEMGYNFIFTDADIMWFRNPFLHFVPDADFQIACDHFTGNPTDLENTANGGFNYVISNNRTIDFYMYWYLSRELYPGKHDQDVLNYIKHGDAIRDIGLKMRFLDTSYFSGFCEARKDFNKVCTMHANCCYGLSNKLNDLRLMLTDWKYFQSMTAQQKRLQRSPWRIPRQCRKKPKKPRLPSHE